MEALSVLAGGVAHDLNNVLAPLVALPDLILDGLDKLKTDERAAETCAPTSSSFKTASLRVPPDHQKISSRSAGQGRTVKRTSISNRVNKVLLGGKLSAFC